MWENKRLEFKFRSLGDLRVSVLGKDNHRDTTGWRAKKAKEANSIIVVCCQYQPSATAISAAIRTGKNRILIPNQTTREEC